MATSFAWFGTLVEVDLPADPAAAVGTELEARGVSVPDDWDDAYAESHVDAPDLAEVPLPAHVGAALDSRDVAWEGNAVRRAVVAAFDPAVETREGALEAVTAARERGPVGLCVNCDVPELLSRTLVRSALERDDFDAIVTSVGCGWRTPAPEIFELTADRLGVEPEDLVHVGDDAGTDNGRPDERRSDDRRSDEERTGEGRADAGLESVGGTTISTAETPLSELPDALNALEGEES